MNICNIKTCLLCNVWQVLGLYCAVRGLGDFAWDSNLTQWQHFAYTCRFGPGSFGVCPASRRHGKSWAELSPEQLRGSCSSKGLFNPFLLSTAGSRSGNEFGKLQKGFSGASFRKQQGRRILLLLILKQKCICLALFKGKWCRRYGLA